MPTRANAYWVDQVTRLKVDNENLGAPTLATRLGLIAEANARAQALGESALLVQARTDAPKEGWVSKWLREEWPKISREDRQKYALVYWPDTFESGALPYCAAAHTLELMRGRHRVAHLSAGEWRPRVRLARWFYKVSLASTGLDFEDRHALAFIMSLRDAGWPSAQEAAGSVEQWLLYGEDQELFSVLMGARLPSLDNVKKLLATGFDQQGEVNLNG